MKKRSSILTDLERNYKDTKSISKSIDLSAIENGVNPHQIYNKFVNDDMKTPESKPTEKVNAGDIVTIIGNNDNKQYEIINIINKDKIILKDLENNEVIQKSENDLKPIMENIDMAKKKINETQYTVSISDLTTTDANALSQMMSAAAQADSGSDVAGLDMTSTPELPTPVEEPVMEPGIEEPIMSDEPSFDDFPSVEEEPTVDEMGYGVPVEEPEMGDEPSFEDSDLEGEDMGSEEDFDMEADMDFDGEEVQDDIKFDEEFDETSESNNMITEDEIVDDKPSNKVWLSDGNIEIEAPKDLVMAVAQSGDNSSAVAELKDAVAQDIAQYSDDELRALVKDYAVDGYDSMGRDELEDYALWLLAWNYADKDEDEEISEDVLLPKATEDETYNAKKKLKDEEDDDSERISEAMDALIKSILENADAKTEQERYAEEITEEAGDESSLSDEEKEEVKKYFMDICSDKDSYPEYDEMKQALRSLHSNGEISDDQYNYCLEHWDEWLKESGEEFFADKDAVEDVDIEIKEALRNAGVQLDEATVKPTIVTDESTFANKPNKATKPEDDKEPKVKEVSTSEFGAEASEPMHTPCVRCEAVAPREKIKKIFETAKVRYSKSEKADWDKLDRRYITKLIENGCGYQRASKIIMEAKKG